MAEENVSRTVLRVKRRRTEDPFQALLVQHSSGKKPKVDGIGDDADDNCIFKFAGTINESGGNNALLLEALQKQQEQEAPISKKIKRLNRKSSGVRVKKHHEKSSPFRIISNHQIADKENVDSSTSLAEKGIKNETKIQICDIEMAPPPENMQQSHGTGEYPEEDSDVILCNSVKMIREKLTISNDSEIEDSEYVYDLYYANENQINSSDELLYIQTLDQDILFDFEINGQFEDEKNIYDDEDDSNDESNWRNEYPEDDDCPTSDENEHSDGESEGDSSSDDARVYFDEYRSSEGRKKFDPYYENDEEDYNYEVYDYDYDDDDS